MKTIELLGILSAQPVFTINDLSRILRRSDSYVKTVAYRLGRMGFIRRIEKGKYTVRDDAIEIASYLAAPSYISFWTALMIHHLTEQLPMGAMVAVAKPRKEVMFNSEKISFTKVSQFWGYTKMRYMDSDIFIAEKEKAVIDCMLAKNTPFDEAAKAILSGDLDYEKLVVYAKKTGSSSLAKRIGFLMEKHDRDASALLDMADSNYIPLDWSSKRKGRKDFRWKVIINTRLDQI
ncbi:MAG: hypothetical protein HZB66_00790 [Candidatus Aenigmarchaeota archaeon]|nr:hypothetical protein [Candidatus Aenigmarchaeota archaeon]